MIRDPSSWFTAACRWLQHRSAWRDVLEPGGYPLFNFDDIAKQRNLNDKGKKRRGIGVQPPGRSACQGGLHEQIQSRLRDGVQQDRDIEKTTT
jgi:hypothetical protein